MSRFIEQAAKEAGALFYIMPSELTADAIDPLLRLAVTLINSSGIAWTAECCQGHPDETDLHAPWGHNVEPYIRMVCCVEDLGTVVTTLLAEAHDSESLIMAPVQMKLHTRPLKNGWTELIVYAVARNSATRNRGCQALERFGAALSAKRPPNKPSEKPHD